MDLWSNPHPPTPARALPPYPHSRTWNSKVSFCHGSADERQLISDRIKPGRRAHAGTRPGLRRPVSGVGAGPSTPLSRRADNAADNADRIDPDTGPIVTRMVRRIVTREVELE